jgi:hypothetical protein
LIAHVHKEEAPDPNSILLSFRNEQERDVKFKGLVGGFLKGRQEALERYAKEVGDSDTKLKAFYEKKIAVSYRFLFIVMSNSGLTCKNIAGKRWIDRHVRR